MRWVCTWSLFNLCFLCLFCSYWFSGSTRKLRLKYALLSFHIHHHFEWTENENKKITRRKMQSGWIEVHSYRMHCTHCGVTHTHTYWRFCDHFFFIFIPFFNLWLRRIALSPWSVVMSPLKLFPLAYTQPEWHSIKIAPHSGSLLDYTINF